MQDAFIGLYRTLPGLRDPEALRSFVVGTALRVARSELRRRRVRRWLALTPSGAVPDTEAQGATDPEARSSTPADSCYHKDVFASPAYCACSHIARSKRPLLIGLARSLLCKFRKKLK